MRAFWSALALAALVAPSAGAAQVFSTSTASIDLGEGRMASVGASLDRWWVTTDDGCQDFRRPLPGQYVTTGAVAQLIVADTACGALEVTWVVAGAPDPTAPRAHCDIDERTRRSIRVHPDLSHEAPARVVATVDGVMGSGSGWMTFGYDGDPAGVPTLWVCPIP